MARRDEPLPLGAALSSALGRVAREGQAEVLRSLWAAVAGPVASSASRPMSFDDGILHVETATLAWAEALRLQSSTLSERLKGQLPRFRGLAIRARGGR